MPRNFPNGVRIGSVVITETGGVLSLKASQIRNDSDAAGATIADVLGAMRAAAEVGGAELELELEALRARIATLETTVETLEERGQ